MGVEDEVELADRVKVLVEKLDEKVDGLEEKQLVVGHVRAEAEVEPGVPAINQLVVPKVHKVRELFVARGHHLVHLILNGAKSKGKVGRWVKSHERMRRIG